MIYTNTAGKEIPVYVIQVRRSDGTLIRDMRGRGEDTEEVARLIAADLDTQHTDADLRDMTITLVDTEGSVNRAEYNAGTLLGL